MRNEKNNNYPQATILLDKLIFSCTSLVEDNFDYVVTHEPEYLYSDFQFGNTTLTKTEKTHQVDTGIHTRYITVNT